MDRKKFILSLPLLLASPSILAQAQTQKKALIIYYSWSGNTRALANIIKKLANADIVEIEPQTPYPKSYNATVNMAKKENDAYFRRPIKNPAIDASKYEYVFVGSPDWWTKLSGPVRAALYSSDFSGKKIAPFMTHEGSGMGVAMKEIESACKNSEILAPLAVWGSAANKAEPDAKKWLAKIGFKA